MRSSVGARRLAVSLAAAAVSLMLLGSAAGAEAAREAPVRVLVPSVGATLPAKPFWLRVKLGSGAHDLKVTLNGRSIPDSQILRGRHHIRRRVQVSPNHGLRFGRNVLRVSARRGRGKPRTDTVRFRVRGSRPLAAAGLDLSATAGNRLLLDGQESMAEPGGSGPLRYRWRIVDRDGRPVGGRTGALEAGGARLVDSDSPEPDFVTAGPETDTIRLTVTAPDGRTGSDLLVVRSDPPPSVHVVVQAKRGQEVGVRLDGAGSVGDAFYPAKLDAWLQVVVLRRDDLTLVSNTSIDCPEATEATFTTNAAQVKRCADILTALLKPLDRSSIVIATSQSQVGGNLNTQPPIGVAPPLGRIGVAPWTWWDANASVLRGTFSAIGSPGPPYAGTAQHVAASQNERTAQLEGTLVRADDGDYNFTPQQQYVSTQAAGSDQNTNVVEIAGHRFVQTLGDHKDSRYLGGFQVVIADPESLQGTSYYFPVGVFYPVSAYRAMTQTLKAANDAGALPFRKPPLVVVTSRGHPQFALGAGRADDGLNEALRLLADQIERAGGTRSAFMDTISPTASAKTHRVSYTLIGQGGSHAGSGQESVGPAPVNDKLDELNTRPIVGTVAQTGQYSAYRLQTPTPTGAEDGASPPNGAMQLVHASGAAPTAWPEAGNAGREAAIRWLGEQVLGTDDPRSQYWTLPYASTTWDGIAGKIAEKGKTYVETADFDAQDLAWASDELQQEIRWLKTSYEYLKSLAEPFQSSVFSAWADMGKVSADIKAKVNVASDAKSIASTELVFTMILNVAAEIPVVGKGVAIMHEAYDAALGLTEIGRGEAPEDEFPVVAGEVGQELAKRFEEAQAFLTKQMPRVIVSDYARLKLVGSCASPLKDDWEACPTDHAQWQFTQADQDQAARSLLRGSKLTSFGALLRAKYSLYELPENQATTANKGFAGITYFTCRVPFVYEPATGQYAKPMLRDLWNPGKNAVDTNVIYALGSLGGVGIIGHPYEMTVPQASVTDELFGTAPGQLAAEPESFFDAFFNPQTLAHFNENDTPIGWKPECGA